MFAFIILMISFLILGYLELNYQLVINLNCFGKMTRDDYLKKNSMEIKRKIMDNEELKIPVAKTKKFENLDFFEKHLPSNLIFYVKNDSDLLIICESENVQEKVDKNTMLELFNSQSNFWSLEIERTAIYRRMISFINNIYAERAKGDIPDYGFVLYDDRNGHLFLLAYDSWLLNISSRKTVYNNLLLKQ